LAHYPRELAYGTDLGNRLHAAGWRRPAARAVMGSGRGVAAGGCRPSGAGRGAVPGLMNRDFTAEVPGW